MIALVAFAANLSQCWTHFLFPFVLTSAEFAIHNGAGCCWKVRSFLLLLTRLPSAILAGWPGNRADVNTDIVLYFSMRDDLAVHDGLIFRNDFTYLTWVQTAWCDEHASVSSGQEWQLKSNNLLVIVKHAKL